MIMFQMRYRFVIKNGERIIPINVNKDDMDNIIISNGKITNLDFNKYYYYYALSSFGCNCKDSWISKYYGFEFQVQME